MFHATTFGDDEIGAPQCRQISCFPLSWFSLCATHFRHLDEIPTVHILIALIVLFLLFVIGIPATQGCEGFPFTFVSPDIQQLLPNRMFGGKTILDICFKERLVPNTAIVSA